MGYFTPFIEQLNLSFLFHFELGKLLRMLWASMCRMEKKLQSSVHLILMDPLPVPSAPLQTWGLDIFPYSTQMSTSSQLACENSSSSFPKISPFPLERKSQQKKERKKRLSYSFSEKGKPFPEFIKQTLPGN